MYPLRKPVNKKADEYTVKRAEIGSSLEREYITHVFDPSERGTWDEVKAVTDVGWFCYSEERLSTDDHLDRVARAGFQFEKGFVTSESTWVTRWYVIEL